LKGKSVSDYLHAYPDDAGYYGRFGGVHYPPELKPHLAELASAYREICSTRAFQDELSHVRKHFQGRPTPVHLLKNLSQQLQGASVFVKREDLNHTGAHKLNHCVGFALLAKHLRKRKLIAETGAGQHGVALATAAAYFGLDCEVHMGAVDIVKARSNVSRMKILGAKVIAADHGQAALKEASDSALTAYLQQHQSALYAIGSAIGPHPFPLIVRDFQAVIGTEARSQFLEATGALPDHVVACVAGGSNALGMFAGFLDDPSVALHGVEPLGRSSQLGDHAATLSFGSEGILHGARCLLLQNEDGSPAKVSSIASGLVYPGVGPEICMLHENGRVSFSGIDDEAAADTFYQLARCEGIIPALESAHAVAFALRLAASRPAEENILVNLSGRGDKDVEFMMERFEQAGRPTGETC
jgi:tryptophan synthase beta chain